MATTPEAHLMRLAIAKATEGISRGQQPFGACLVKDGEVLACLYNAVVETLDITAHPEIQAIREACRHWRTLDLSGTVLYATCEPCPMCFTAAHLAQVTTIVYGVRLADAQQYGFGRSLVPNATMKTLGQSPIEIIGDFLRDEGMALLRMWSERQTIKA
jgi:tRNA(Arg) A34 adenosine deaminase TadA